MKHFNYNQLPKSIFNCEATMKTMLCPEVGLYGKVVTIGRGKKYKVIYIATDENFDKAMSYLDSVKDAPPFYSKVIQYVKAINGYILAYTSI